MPIYEYVCQHCGSEFEALVRMEDRLTSPCKSCGAQAKFKISTPRIALDGTDPAFPDAYAKWDKKREQKIKEEKAKSYYEGD